MIDLHTHSNASDGELSPADLIVEAQKRGVSVLALTDHDTLGGLDVAAATAKTCGMGFIHGIEISISWNGTVEANGLGIGSGGEMHLLGLGIHSPSSAFLGAICELSGRRQRRNMEILGRMNELGIEANWDEVLAISGNAVSSNIASGNTNGIATGGYSVGRPHFASLLVQKNIVKNTEQAFARYLGYGKPLYVPKTGLGFEEAAFLIRQSGGIPVLAHPMSLFMAWGRLPNMIKSLKELGLMGLEAWHPVAKTKYCRRLEELAGSLDLYITEGSDFHGGNRPDRKLGRSGKDREISDSLLEALPDLMAH
jgi:predicted metal-dependent phosphoesterase TrpH